ncbi:hypothetical protein AYI69_g7855 [Smittium culicis]|uniref:Uncharacterized protein n=1 Tax=Smittium culicis TaxID=133412 RepID=A0A1R1XP23_9FUNG|nr:hypothetical protein AYI69_g7855 [Smittium culicis]
MILNQSVFFLMNGTAKVHGELSSSITGKKSALIGQSPRERSAASPNAAAKKAGLDVRQDNANVPDGTEDIDVDEPETFPIAKKRKRSADKPAKKCARAETSLKTGRSKLTKRARGKGKKARAKQRSKPAPAIPKKPEHAAPAAPGKSKGSTDHAGRRKSVSRRLDQAAPPPETGRNMIPGANAAGGSNLQTHESPVPAPNPAPGGTKYVPIQYPANPDPKSGPRLQAPAMHPQNSAALPVSSKLDYVPVPNNVANPPHKPAPAAPQKAPYFGEKMLSSPKPSNSTADNGQKQAEIAPNDAKPADNGQKQAAALAPTNGQKQDAVAVAGTGTGTGTGEKQWGGAGGWNGWNGNNWGWGWGGNNWGWGGQGCGGNQYVCQGNDYLQCSNGNYIQRFCGYGTRCQSIYNGGITCGY